MTLQSPDLRGKITGGLLGGVIGDALGMPAEGFDREKLRRRPVTDMAPSSIAGLPAGSWTDDSSLTLCSVECLLEEFDTHRLADLFLRWDDEGYWTPAGFAFGRGLSTAASLDRLRLGIDPEKAGGADEDDNGNGSLMRILPVALRYARAPCGELLSYAHRASAVTHRHPRSWMACGFYCLLAAALLQGDSPEEAYTKAIDESRRHYAEYPFDEELRHFEALFSGRMVELPEHAIQSSGYVMHTLEAGVWCLLTTDSYREAVLTAVNLGGDTDTTGIVTGGLAGTYYGLDAIPAAWIEQTARQKDLMVLFEQFAEVCIERDFM